MIQNTVTGGSILTINLSARFNTVTVHCMSRKVDGEDVVVLKTKRGSKIWKTFKPKPFSLISQASQPISPIHHTYAKAHTHILRDTVHALMNTPQNKENITYTEPPIYALG